MSDVVYLHILRGLRSRDLRLVLHSFPTEEALRAAGVARLGTQFPNPLAERLGALISRWDELAERARMSIDRCRQKDIRVVSILSSGYPSLLRLIVDAPPLLFVRGSVEAIGADRAIAVVGTRAPSDRGREVAERIAKHFAGRGFSIVSGLAKGIDNRGAGLVRAPVRKCQKW